MPPLISDGSDDEVRSTVLDNLLGITELTLVKIPGLIPDNKISSGYTCSCSECLKNKFTITSKFGYARNRSLPKNGQGGSKKDTEPTVSYSLM
jgi:hypothetical protein